MDLDKEQIISNNNDKAGVYMFKNLVNKKRYVGSSVNIRRRMHEYFNINYLERKKCMPICRALLKYGYSKFSLEILEYCQPSEVISREQYFIDFLQPEYNILKTAGSSLGYKHDEEARAKMSTSKKGQNHPMFGKIRSEETRAQISAALKGKIQSEEDKAKKSASMMGKNS
jgi:group I intron endonuclease